MREIIFRGKTLDGERWVEDDLIHCLGVQRGQTQDQRRPHSGDE